MASPQPMQILFVDADLPFRNQLTCYLAANGLEVEVFGDFCHLGAAPGRDRTALVLLDLTVAGQDGIAFLRNERLRRGFAWVVLSCSQDETDPVVCLEFGADDFIRKSMGQHENLARLRAVMRRTVAAGAGPRQLRLAHRIQTPLPG